MGDDNLWELPLSSGAMPTPAEEPELTAPAFDLRGPNGEECLVTTQGSVFAEAIATRLRARTCWYGIRAR